MKQTKNTWKKLLEFFFSNVDSNLYMIIFFIISIVIIIIFEKEKQYGAPK